MKVRFDTHDACRKMQQALLGESVRDSLNFPSNQAARNSRRQNLRAECVSEKTLSRWRELEWQQSRTAPVPVPIQPRS